MGIEALFEMKKEPGVVVVGKKNTNVEQVFDAISTRLYEFYDSNGKQFEPKGLVFVSRIWQHGQDTYFCHVYVDEMPTMEIVHKRDRYGRLTRQEIHETRLKEHATIKIGRIDQKKGREFVKNWDFPHAPFEYTQQVFAVYFNLVDASKAEAERNAFLTYARHSGLNAR